jgi:phage host-nuclease inhibitor protein Gam
MQSDFKWNDSPQWSAFVRGVVSGSLPSGHGPLTDASVTNGDALVPLDVMPDDLNLALPLTQAYGLPEDISRLMSSDAFKQERGSVNPLHVEILLDQAAELLERVLRTRERIAALRISGFQSTAEFWEFYQLDKIHEREIALGRYSAPVDEKVAQVNSTQTQIKSLKDELQITAQFVDWLTANKDAVLSASKTITAASTLAGDKWDGQQPDPSKTIRTQSLFAWSEPMHKADIDQRFAAISATKTNLAGAISATEERIKGEGANAKYMTDSLPLQLQRIRVARDLFRRKLWESRRSGSVLNYPEQVDPLVKSADHDLTHALARLAAASDGMADLFGYAPKDKFYSPPTDNRPFSLDDCAQWARDAISWLRTFVQKDETITVPISLKRVMGDAWRNPAGEWQFEFSDLASSSEIWGQMLNDRRYIRFRSLSAYFDGLSAERETCQLNVQLPTQGNVRHADNKLYSLKDQAKLKSVWLGRVERRTSQREPEIVGTSTLLNASPFGKWKVTALDQSAEGASLFQTRRLEDLIIEVTVVAQSPHA